MRRTLFVNLLILLGLSMGKVVGQLPSYVPTPGLVAWYALDGDAHDVSGNGHHGTLLNVSSTSDRFFQPNHAYLVPSSGGQIDCGDDPAYDLTECTLSAWVRPTNLIHPEQTIIARLDSEATASYGMQFTYDRFRSVLFVDTTKLQYECTNQLLTGQWMHFAATYNATLGLSLYINGALCRQQSFTGPLRTGPAGGNLRIGAIGANSVRNLHNMKVDEVGIWNRALGAEEIESMYLASVVAKEEPSLANSVHIGPNPSATCFRVLVDLSWMGASYTLLDPSGMAVRRGIVTGTEVLIDVKQLSAGTYLLRLAALAGNFSKILIVSH